VEAEMNLLRFPDLVERGIVNSRMTLKRLIESQGFPPGLLITPNARAWNESEVEAWIASRPITRKTGMTQREAAVGDES
jgi:predicted DNA-binding transcriptional regulator AlpA